MKVGVLICLLLLVGSTTQDSAVQKGPFEEATRTGDPTQITFFLFSTSYGDYVISQYGLGEVGTPGRHLQFLLKTGRNGRVQRMYFREYEGDLLLSFEMGETGYVRRMNQPTRKMRWLTPVDKSVINQCVVEGDEVRCDSTKIDLKTGKIKDAD